MRFKIALCLGIMIGFCGYAHAKITKIEDYTNQGGYSNVPIVDNYDYSCNSLGSGWASSPSNGFSASECTQKRYHGVTCYNCEASCNAQNFRYTSSNCASPKVLSGRHCRNGSVERYESCGCDSNWVTCASPLIGSGTKCTIGNVDKYASCKCPDDYVQCDNKPSNAIGGKCTSGNKDYYKLPGNWNTNWKTCENTPNLPYCTNGSTTRYYVSNLTACEWGGTNNSCKVGDNYYMNCKAEPDCSGFISCRRYKDTTGSGGSCTNSNGTFYEKCVCPTKYEFTCSSTGQSGVGACTEAIMGTSGSDGSDNSGSVTTTKKYESCTCPGYYDCSAYPYSAVAQGATSCTLKPGGKELYSNCVCQAENFIYNDNNCINYNGTACDGNYDQCTCSGLGNPLPNCSETDTSAGETVVGPKCNNGKWKYKLTCSAGDYLYRRRAYDSEGNGAWYTSLGSDYPYPPFACGASGYSGNTGCYNDDTKKITASCEEVDITYEKTGIMISNKMAVDISDNWLRADEYYSSGDRYRYTSSWAALYTEGAFVTPTPGSGHNYQYNGYTTSSSARGGTYLPDLHGHSSATAPSGVSTGSTLGPRVTYNYTFGVGTPTGVLSQGIGWPLGTISDGAPQPHYNRTYSDTSYDFDVYGHILPAWYCMQKNIGVTRDSEYSRWVNGEYITDLQLLAHGSGEPLQKTFNTNKNSVFYYLPTANDWNQFNSYIATHSGQAEEIFGTDQGAIAWTSTYKNPQEVYVYGYQAREGEDYTHYTTGMFAEPVSVATSLISAHVSATSYRSYPMITKCFIYLPGYQPNDSCGIDVTYGANYSRIRKCSAGCTAQSQ